ncbi:MAG: ABC transporter ATP-binding protein [Candidatus Aminicenantes bacterium]|nr:ABC transporter ATP-binding protein [Candidatus Aminicenantes bacterium]HHF51482.1 ABC transporter ATP-binding protein [Candidatus Aminicenantes bacterium]
MKAVIMTEKLSKWYGNILGLSDVTLDIEAGITGLLGPNGAGKSTFLKLVTGQIKANIGSVRINGEEVRNNHRLFSKIGFCPESDSFYEEMTGWEFVTGLLKLHGLSSSEREKKALKALGIVDLEKNKDRRIKTYSRGMRQRLKFAQAIAHEPEILILDEPLNGLDPLGRRKLIRLIKSLRDEGKTVIVSSHVLPEIEAMTNDIILIHQGKIFAQGDIHYIRDLIDAHPHMISVKCSDPRKVASRFIKEDFILNIDFSSEKDTFVVKTNNRDEFFSRLPRIFIEENIDVKEITSPDDNLQAVFDYLIGE